MISIIEICLENILLLIIFVETKDTVWEYNLKTGKWHFFATLNVARSVFRTLISSLDRFLIFSLHFRKSCACFYDGKSLFVAGGATAELDQLSSVEKFNPISATFEIVENLPKGLAASVTGVTCQLPIRLMQNYRELAQSNMS